MKSEVDAKMRRTAKRPLPRRADGPQSALHFGVGLAFFGAPDGACDQLARGDPPCRFDPFYVLVYTVWLKPRTAQNIVIGGAAGAFPPLIGWVAATGHIATLPLLLFAIIFLWTPPQFWALSLFVRSDYAAAGSDAAGRRGRRSTRRQIFLYTPADGRRSRRALAPRLTGASMASARRC